MGRSVIQRCCLAAGLVLEGAGCGCPPFAEMTVEDRRGLGTPLDRLHTRRAILDFARWTGDPGVCVPAVEVVDQIEDGRFLGVYQGPRQPILQVPAAGHGITVHELCHAADEQHGWLSNEHKALMPVGHIDPVGYPSRYAQEHESFARICETGPTGLDLQQLVEERCGIELEHPAQRLVLREIYASESAELDAGRAAGRLELVARSVEALVGGDEVVDVASDDEQIWILTRAGAGGADPELLASAALAGAERLSLWAVDPASLVLRGVHHLVQDPGETRIVRRMALADAVDGRALLVESTLVDDAPGPARVWRLDAPGAAPVLLGQSAEALGLVSGPLRSFVDDAHLYTHVVPGAGPVVPLLDEAEPGGDAEVSETWAAVEGDWVALALPGLEVDDTALLESLQDPLWMGVVTRISARAGGAQYTVSAPPSVNERRALENTALMVWTDDREAAERVDLRRALLRQSLAVLPGNTVLGRWGDTGLWDGLDALGGLVVGEPEERTWFLPDDACTGQGRSLQVDRAMEVDGAALLLARDEGGPVLVRVELEG